ncbi:MAG: hypothetical protein NTV80_07640 [Verrucomicrobia bacterium]|nr:hypothetical protein [Verrucomicrobiota bacterium]
MGLYDEAISVSSSEDLISKVADLSNKGQFERWAILDHGLPGVQTLGTKGMPLSAAAFVALAQNTSSPNGAAFYGCSVANDGGKGMAFYTTLKGGQNVNLTAWSGDLIYHYKSGKVTYPPFSMKITMKNGVITKQEQNRVYNQKITKE